VIEYDTILFLSSSGQYDANIYLWEKKSELNN